MKHLVRSRRWVNSDFSVTVVSSKIDGKREKTLDPTSHTSLRPPQHLPAGGNLGNIGLARLHDHRLQKQ